MAVNSFYNRIRISGLASGLDTERIVADIMRAQRIPLNRLKQNQQLAQWKQNDYREIINILNDFSKEFLNITNPASNMCSSAQYKKFNSSIKNKNGELSNIVSAFGTTDAMASTHKIIVNRLATSASETSSTKISKNLMSGDLRGNLNLNGKSILINIDGVSKEIKFDSDFLIDSQESGDAFALNLQSMIDEAFGLGIGDLSKVNITYNHSDGKITFSENAGANKITVSSSITDDGLSELKMANNSSNRINLSLTLEELSNTFNSPLVFEVDPEDGIEKIKFTVNNKEFSFNKDTKLSTVINTINNDTTAKVNLSYNSITDTFTLTSKQTGSGKNISIVNTLGNFFGDLSAVKINPGTAGFGSNGVDALVTIDGQDLVRSNNSFTEGGITYNLIGASPDEELTVTLTSDVDSVYNNITNFIKKYNEVIDKIYSKFTEKYDSEFPPLTDEQKEAMKEEEIKKWEEIAKKGLLLNDPNLDRILTNFRMAMIDSIADVNTTLAKIGITSSSYKERGKLTVDEAKLKEAIKNDPDGVMNLFCKRSETMPDYNRKSTLEEQEMRYKEQGIAHRIYDIVQDNISLVMNSNKQKGILLEKAGLEGDITDRTSTLSKEISSRKDAIEELEERLFEKEEFYYKKFTAMETALSKLYSQSSWISSMLFNNQNN